MNTVDPYKNASDTWSDGESVRLVFTQRWGPLNQLRLGHALSDAYWWNEFYVSNWGPDGRN